MDILGQIVTAIVVVVGFAIIRFLIRKWCRECAKNKNNDLDE